MVQSMPKLKLIWKNRAPRMSDEKLYILLSEFLVKYPQLPAFLVGSVETLIWRIERVGRMGFAYPLLAFRGNDRAPRDPAATGLSLGLHSPQILK